MIHIIFSYITGRDQSYFQPAGFSILLYDLILDRIYCNTYFRYRVEPDTADIAVFAMIPTFRFFFTSIKNAQKLHTAALQLIGN